MKKLIILIKIIVFIIAFYIIFIAPEVEAEKADYFYMNVTFYSLHEDCIADKWNDGKTATNTDIRVGACAINVDMINGRWQVVSPLKLGDRILIEGLGIFSVEDTGRFGEVNAIQDIWTVDVFEPDHKKAKEGGKEVRKVYVVKGSE